MLNGRMVKICGIVIFLFIIFPSSASINAADTTDQIIKQIDQILAEKPLPAGEKGQMIKIAEDDTITLFVGRMTEGGGVKPHFHKTHDESIYVIKGTVQLFINDKWVDLKPGSLHFNPKGKVHGITATGNEPAVVISIFTPALKDADRHFAK